jgi:branched-chain amino acid transport system permease protein
MAAVGVIFMVFVLFFPRGVWGSALHGLRRRVVKKGDSA